MFIQDVDEDISMSMLAVNHADALFSLIDESRLHLREWLSWVDQIQTVADSILFIKDGFQIYAERSGLTAGIFYKGVLVGIAGYNYFDWRNHHTQIGYWLGEEYQGYGIMTRAVRFLTDYAFRELYLNRVEIKVAYGNEKSEHIPKRLNYTKEGHLRQAEWLYDHHVDHIVYSMLREDWIN